CSAATTSSVSAISRSMRSRVAPATLRCNASTSASGMRAGICTSQVGADLRRISITIGPPGARQSCPSASRTGKYASPAPGYSRYTAPVFLEALSRPDRPGSGRGGAVEAGVDDGRLPHPRLAGANHQLAVPLLRPCGPPLQLRERGRPSDHGALVAVALRRG